MDSPCRKDRLPVDYVQRRLRRNEFRDHGERDSGESGKVFGFRPESLFTFIPESRSTSSRNPVHLPAGMPFSLPRNTQARFSEAASLRVVLARPPKLFSRAATMQTDCHRMRSPIPDQLLTGKLPENHFEPRLESGRGVLPESRLKRSCVIAASRRHRNGKPTLMVGPEFILA